MAEKRMISASLFEDEWFGVLIDLEKLVWIGLIVSIADDQGRFVYNPALIRSKLFTYKDIELGIIDGALNEIISSGKVLKYSSGGKDICQITNWWKHQNPSWAAPSRYPAPEGWIDRVRYHIANQQIRLENWNTPGGFIGNSLPSELPSGLVTGIEKRREEKRREEEESTNSLNLSDFDDMRILIETKTGYPVPNTKNDIDALNEFVKWGTTESDVDDAIEFFRNNGKIARGPYSLRNSIRTSIAKRTQKNGKKPYKDTKVWSEEC